MSNVNGLTPNSFRIEFHRGTYEGRILGDDGFSENALAKAEEKFQGRLELHQIIDAVCAEYAIDADMLAESGKKQPASKARTIVAYLGRKLSQKSKCQA